MGAQMRLLPQAALELRDVAREGGTVVTAREVERDSVMVGTSARPVAVTTVDDGWRKTRPAARDATRPAD
jgi:hypothetical protein